MVLQIPYTPLTRCWLVNNTMYMSVPTVNKAAKFVPGRWPSTGQPNLRFVCRLLQRYAFAILGNRG